MTGPVIPAELWPEGAVALVWSAFGFGKWIVVDDAAGTWEVERADIPMPDGWDWRVPVMRPSEQPAPAIDLELVREAVEAAIAHAGPNDGSLAGWQRLLAQIDGQAGAAPTDRDALLWVLWHRQGGSSPLGQPLRKHLGIGPHEPLTDGQLESAKRFHACAGAMQPTKGEGGGR